MTTNSTKKLLLYFAGILVVLMCFLVTYTPDHLRKLQENYSPRELKDMYDKSQYTVPNSKKPISDAVLYTFTGSEYAKGDNPLRLNAEHLTTGKYIIGFLYNVTGHMKVSGLLFVIAIFAIVNFFLFRSTSSLFSPIIFSIFYVLDTNIRYQITGGPLLDIIQLFFLILFFIFVYAGSKTRTRGFINFFLSGIMLGLMASSKMYVPTLIAITSFVFYLLIQNKLLSKKALFELAIVCVFAFLTYTLTYSVYFLKYDGSIYNFMKSQLWILHFWTDNPVNKVVEFGAVVPLIFLNQYHVWWGNKHIIPYEDWTIVWPISFILITFTQTIVSAQKFFPKFIKLRQLVSSRFCLMLTCWISVFFLYLILIPISPRYFILLFVPGYILVALVAYELYTKNKQV